MSIRYPVRRGVFLDKSSGEKNVYLAFFNNEGINNGKSTKVWSTTNRYSKDKHFIGKFNYGKPTCTYFKEERFEYVMPMEFLKAAGPIK